MSWSIESSVHSPGPRRGREPGGWTSQPPPTVRYPAGALRACALRWWAKRRGSWAYWTVDLATHSPSEPPRSWKQGSWELTVVLFTALLLGSHFLLCNWTRSCKSQFSLLFSKLTYCCPHLEDTKSYSRRI